jgi:hypothetical protein
MPFLFFVASVELIGRYYSRELNISNAWLYNISIPVEYLFYTFLFRIHYLSHQFRRVALYFIIVFPVFAIINHFFIQNSISLNTNLLKVGSFFMILFSCLFFIEFLRIEKIMDPLKQPFFWVSTGILLFNAGEFSYNVFFEYFFKNWDEAVKMFRTINNSLLYVLYSCITIAMIATLWTKEE